MLIKEEKTLQAIQDEFSTAYPFLKIEFYASGHKMGEGTPAGQQLDPSRTIGEVRQKTTEGDLELVSNMKVVDVERLFRDKYELNVQIFRKSGEIWLQTTATDEWTLAEQNRKGERSTLALYDSEE